MDSTPSEYTDDQSMISGASNSYRINNKSVLLTYNSKDDPDKLGDIDEFFQHFFGDSFYSGNDAEGTVADEYNKNDGLHRHLFYARMSTRIDCQITHFMWNGIKPNVKQFNSTKSNFPLSCQRQHFYLQNQYKIGGKEHRTTNLIDSVPTKMVHDACIAHKMEWEDCVACAVAYNCVTPQLKSKVELQIKLKESQMMQKMLEEEQKLLDAEYEWKTFKHYNEIFQWASQYDYRKPRYNFLILWSWKTKTGKSELAKSLYKNYYEHTSTIDWKKEGKEKYNWKKHECVIYNDVDDIYKIIIENKELFQSNCKLHSVHTSATNMLKEEICLYRKPQIVTCNFDPSCYPWITGNAYVLEITEQTWHENPRSNYTNMNFEWKPTLEAPSIIVSASIGGEAGESPDEAEILI